MDSTGSSATTTLTSTSRRSPSMCASTTRKRSTVLSMGYLFLSVVIIMIAFQFSSPVLSASLNKRSTDSDETCRNNGICGWEVYHPSSRNLQYYVASSCKCSAKEACIRAEDDISISAYVFRCRDQQRRRKTTRTPTMLLNETS